MFEIASVMSNLVDPVSTAIGRRFEPESGQNKDYKFCICCFSARHVVLSNKSKHRSVHSRDNEFCDISSCWLLFQWASTKTK